MEYIIKGISELVLEHNNGEQTSAVRTVNINIEVSKNVNRENFYTEDGIPSADGVKAMSQCFIQGLVANIKFAQSKGYWKEVEHLEYAIAEIQKSFVALSDDPHIGNFQM